MLNTDANYHVMPELTTIVRWGTLIAVIFLTALIIPVLLALAAGTASFSVTIMRAFVLMVLSRIGYEVYCDFSDR